MRLLKYVAFALGGLAALTAILVAFLVATFDAPRVKAELARIVKEEKDRTLVIEGDLKLSFWPRLRLDLGHTSLSERGSEKEFAAFDQVQAALALWPLVLQRVVVDEVRLDGASATLIRGADGNFNFDDLITKQEQKSELVRFDVAGVRLTNGRVAYRDEKAGGSFDLTGVELTTGRLGNLAEGPLTASFSATGEKPKLASNFKLSGRYRIDLDQGQYTLAGLRFNAGGDAAGLKALDLAVAAEKLDVRPGKGELDLAGARLAISGNAEAARFFLNADVPLLAMVGEKSTAAPMSVQLQWLAGQNQADVKLALAALEAVGNSVKIPEVKAEVSVKQGQLALQGALKSPLTADLAAQAGELPTLHGEFTVAHPDLARKSLRIPLNGSLHADAAKSALGGKLSARLDDTTLEAQLDVPGAAPYAAAFELDVDQIDIDRYFPPKAKAAPAGAPGKEADAPIDFSALKSLNVKGSVRVGSLKVHNVKATNLRFTIGAAGGKLDIAPLAANLYQGTAAGTVRINAQGNQIALQQDLAGVSIQPLLKDAFGRDLIEGRGNLSVDVSTGGASVAAMKRGLQGTARIAIKNGALRGVDLPQIVRDWKIHGSPKQAAVRRAIPDEKTPFSDFGASFRIANGVAHNSDLSARSSLLRLTGEGSIDIAAASANYLVKASLLSAPPGLDARQFALLKGVAVPVQASGPLDHLSYQVQAGELATEIVKGQVESRVSEAKAKLEQKAREELRKGLKGFFGG